MTALEIEDCPACDGQGFHIIGPPDPVFGIDGEPCQDCDGRGTR